MKEPTRYQKGKNVYIIGSWHVDKSLEVFVWLTKTFGEGFVTIFMSPEKGEAVGKVFDGGEVQGDESKLIEEFVSKIVNRLDPKEYTAYAKTIVQGTRVNGQEINFNEHFCGRIGELHGLLFQILRHQYGDFLGGSESED